MSLTAAEQAELDALESEAGSLTSSEAQELAQLEKELGQQEDTVIKNEMPEGFTGRFTAKNFGGNSEAVFNYLQKENPDFEIKKDPDGEILARRRGAKEWGRMDPKGFDVRDLTDIAYDIPAGIAQGAATTIAGLAGGAASGGIGAIPSAMAASAGSGTALEAARQGIGSMMGIKDNMSGTDIALSGGLGAVSPLMFGTGAGAKDIVKAGAKKAMSSEALKDLAFSQKGLLGKAWDKTAGVVGPGLAKLAGGYPKEIIEAASENLPLIKASDNAPELVSAEIQRGKDVFTNSLKSALSETGERLGSATQALDAKGAMIPTKNIIDPLIKLREQLAGKGMQTPYKKEMVADVDNILAKYFTTGEEGETALQMSTYAAKEVSDQMNDLGQKYGLNMANLDTTKGVVGSKTTGSKDVLRAIMETGKNARDEISSVARKIDPELAQKIDDVKMEYGALKDMQDDFFNATKTEEAFGRFLKKKGASAEVAKQKMSTIAGEDVNKLGAKITALEMFRKPSWQIPAFGGSNTARTMGSGALGAFIGASIGQKAGTGTYIPTVIGAGLGTMAASPAMIRKYIGTNQALTQLPQKLPAYKYLPYIMQNTAKNKGE